jgi:MFS family permease
MTENIPPARSVPLWRNNDYMLLWSGQLVSSVGIQVSQLAFPLFVLALTHSPVQAGLIGAVRLFPYLLLSLPAGALVDRWDRKRVMLICDSGRAISMASIPIALFIGNITLVQLYVVSLVEGTLMVFFNLAEVACLPQVVTKEQLPGAMAQNYTTYSIASLLGSSLGGLFYSIGKVIPFLADAISYTVSVISLFFIKASFQEERAASSFSLYKLWLDIREGLFWLWRQPLIRLMAVLISGYNLVLSGSTLFMIVLAQHLHASAFAIGLVFSATSVGGIVGSWLAAWVQKRLSFGQSLVSVSWLMIILVPLLFFAPNVLIMGIAGAVFLLVFPSCDLTQMTYRVSIIPDRLQGRVNSVFRLIAMGGNPLGLSLTGLLLQDAGLTLTGIIFVSGFVLLAIATTLSPHIRHAPSVAEVKNVGL